jgi:Uma2 family endonuclease
MMPTMESGSQLTHAEFYKLCEAYPDAKLELSASGKLVVTLPTGGVDGIRNAKLARRLGDWTEADGTGIAFDSSTMFKLPNGAMRSPDAAWVLLDRWNALSLEEQESFPPICPDFVVELRSKTDTLKSMQDKMQEYLDNGARLGFLLNPQGKQAEIYRSGEAKQVLNAPLEVSGEDVLKGFILRLEGIL